MSNPQPTRSRGSGLVGSAALEVLGRDLVEELPELLDLVLLLVGHREAGLVEHVLGADDRGAGAQREGDRVRGPGADLDAAVEDQLGVEDAVLAAR